VHAAPDWGWKEVNPDVLITVSVSITEQYYADADLAHEDQHAGLHQHLDQAHTHNKYCRRENRAS
jgi:hypothetical protein